MRKEYKLTQDQTDWASKRKQGLNPGQLREMIIQQKGLCAFSNIPMYFNKVKYGTPIKGEKGCHPLYAAVDHVSPGNPVFGHRLVCYALNDLKGQLPNKLFESLQNTKEWKQLMRKWRAQCSKSRSDVNSFKALLND